MTEKRFELENEDGEIGIKDNIRKKYIFTFVCEDIDMQDGMLEECEKVVNCLNQIWEQTQRFEKYNEEYIEDNEKLKKENEELKRKHYNELMEEGVKIERLREENEELKKENKELKTSKEYWREKCLSKDSYNKLYHKAPIWFTQSAKLTDKQANEIAEAINQSLKERRIKK